MRHDMTENRLPDFSTLALGEEGHTTVIAGEEDFATHAATERTLQAATTLPISEETTSFISGEEVTTEALGEEGPTTTDGENPSPADFSRKGGPFGAY
jgi:hypothetical protein